MSLRLRLTLLVAAAVAVSVAGASAIVYVVVGSNLKDEVDRTLQDRVAQAGRRPGPRLGLPPGPPVLAFGGYVQFVRLGGPEPALVLPGQDRAERVAAGESGPFFAEGHVNGTHVRVFTAPVGPGTAVQAMRSLEEVDRSLRTIGLALLAIGLGGIAVAAALGLFVAQTALAPVRRLTDLAEEVTHTRDLSQRVQASGSDELNRLGRSLNAMLDALEESMAAHRRLVADASHELRTPLASLRTNVEVLAGGKRLDPRERARLLADVVGQIEELTLLVADLVEIDRDGRPPELEDVRLDELVLAALERTRTRTPGLDFRAEIEPAIVRGEPARLDRAVSNLLDNAAKWSAPGGTIEVGVAGTEVSVRDYGPGIADEDLPYIFDRFYRSASARKLPGSGLGLAIARQVAETHGGAATAENAPGGGALFRLRLPAAT